MSGGEHRNGPSKILLGVPLDSKLTLVSKDQTVNLPKRESFISSYYFVSSFRANENKFWKKFHKIWLRVFKRKQAQSILRKSSIIFLHLSLQNHFIIYGYNDNCISRTASENNRQFKKLTKSWTKQKKKTTFSCNTP